MPESPEDLIALEDVRAIADLGRSATRSATTEDAVRTRLRVEMSAPVLEVGRSRSGRSRTSTATEWVRRRRRVVVAGAAVCAAVAGVSLLATSGTPGHAFPEAVAELARQAQRPAAIVHVTVTGDDVEGQLGARRETWATLDGSTIRYRTMQRDGDYTDVLLERRADESRLTMYSSKKNTVFRSPWTRRPPRPSGTNHLSITDITRYADAIKDGNAKLAGETVIDGISAYRVTQAVPGGTQTWFVSKDAQQPRLLRIQRACSPGSEPCPRTDFHAYSITNDRDSLKFPDHAGAPIKAVEVGGVDGGPPPATK